MANTTSTDSVRQFDTLVSPLEAADEPSWFTLATPQERRRLLEVQKRGRASRLHAMRSFSGIQSLYDYCLTELGNLDVDTVTASTLYDIQHRHSTDELYPTYLNGMLAKSDLREALDEAYGPTLQEESTLAALKGHVAKDGLLLLEWLIGAFALGSAEFNEKGPFVGTELTVVASLQLLGTLQLPEIILVGPDNDESICVAFVPGHPVHPVKQYSSRSHFLACLRKELLDASFQRFFCRFVPVRRRSRLLAACLNRASILALPLKAEPLKQGLRHHLYEHRVARLLDDARWLIPTSAKAAATLQIHCPDIAVALQQHLIMGAGPVLSVGEENEGQIPSDWMCPMHLVKTGSASYRRWLPDLSVYRLSAAQVPNAKADAKGLFETATDKVIQINQDFYQVEQRNDAWYLLHPTCNDLYSPRLYHNGAGAWRHRFEQPGRWGRVSLLRRLGPVSAGLDDQQLLQIGRISGVSNTTLRQVHVKGEPAPALLVYLLERARIHDEVEGVLALVAEGLPVPAGYDVPLLRAYYQIKTEQGTGRSRPRRSGDQTPAPCDDQAQATCPATIALVYLSWRLRLSRALFAHRFELAQVPTDAGARELRRRYPHLPLAVAQRLLDDNRSDLNVPLLPATTLPLDFAQQARDSAQDARLAAAMEGFTQRSLLNNDTFTLAFHLLEYLDGWIPGTALLLRNGGRFGDLLAELGTTDVDTPTVYRDDEEGWYAVGRDQTLLTQDMTEYGFYRALLYALGAPLRTALGFGLNEPERLHQRLTELALTRPSRARLLLNLPIESTWLTPSPAGVASSPARAADEAPLEREPAVDRLARLYTRGQLVFFGSDAEIYLNYLLQHNQPIGPRITQLESERALLVSTLSQWVAQAATAAARQARETTVRDLLHAWESHIGQRQDGLHLGNHLIGEVPPLPVSLPAVVSLHVADLQQISHLPALLERLPNLRRLELINLPLTQLPALGTLQHLRLLNLSRTRIAPSALSVLGNLRCLHTLIMNDVELFSFNWTHQNMQRMLAGGSLHTLTLQNSRLSFGEGVFAVLARSPSLQMLNLTYNLITLRDQDVTDMAGLVNLRVLDLSGNPLWRPPVLTRLQALEELDLSGTDLTQWPTGLERLPNISSADLRYLAITQVPDGAGRTRGLRMSSEHLEPAVRQQFEADMNAVGNVYSDSEESMDEDSDGQSPPQVPSPASFRTASALNDAPRLFDGFNDEELGYARQLLDDGNSFAAEFFALLLRIDVGAEARIPETRIRQRIQALIRSVFNPRMRTALYKHAQQAATCVDRDALVFSEMENLYHADQAIAKAVDEQSAAELITLGTNSWRLVRLREHLTFNTRRWRQLGHTVEYAEIELYYRIALTDRLHLRDQPRTQVFTAYTDWVTPAMLDEAYTYVTRRDDAAWSEYLNAQPFWRLFIDQAYVSRIGPINQWQTQLGDALDEAESNTAGFATTSLTDSEQQRLRQLLVDSGQLGHFAALPAVLRLSNVEVNGISPYNQAYAALVAMVERARLALTREILEAPVPGPSWR